MTALAEQVSKTEGDRLLTRQEAADLLGHICLKTLDRLIAEKKIKAVHVGRRTLVVHSSTQRFIREGSRG